MSVLIWLWASGEDRFFYGYALYDGTFLAERKRAQLAMARDGVDGLFALGADTVCLDGASTPATAFRSLQKAQADRYAMTAHAKPNNDSSITLFLGFPNGHSAVFYLPKSDANRAAMAAAFPSQREAAWGEAAGCLDRRRR